MTAPEKAQFKVIANALKERALILSGRASPAALAQRRSELLDK
ncbi:MAG: hypothetical protein ACLRW2_09940 [Parasutterella excrementihominis]